MYSFLLNYFLLLLTDAVFVICSYYMRSLFEQKYAIFDGIT